MTPATQKLCEDFRRYLESYNAALNWGSVNGVDWIGIPVADVRAALSALAQEQDEWKGKPEVDWDERYRTMPATKCLCGQMDIAAAFDGVQWYWQHHGRTGCTLELPDLVCWCGLKRSEHIDGHAEGVTPPGAQVAALPERPKAYLAWSHDNTESAMVYLKSDVDAYLTATERPKA